MFLIRVLHFMIRVKNIHIAPLLSGELGEMPSNFYEFMVTNIWFETLSSFLTSLNDCSFFVFQLL